MGRGTAAADRSALVAARRCCRACPGAVQTDRSRHADRGGTDDGSGGACVTSRRTRRDQARRGRFRAGADLELVRPVMYGRQHGDRNDTSPDAAAIGAASRKGTSVTVETNPSTVLTSGPPQLRCRSAGRPRSSRSRRHEEGPEVVGVLRRGRPAGVDDDLVPVEHAHALGLLDGRPAAVGLFVGVVSMSVRGALRASSALPVRVVASNQADVAGVDAVEPGPLGLRACRARTRPGRCRGRLGGPPAGAASASCSSPASGSDACRTGRATPRPRRPPGR